MHLEELSSLAIWEERGVMEEVERWRRREGPGREEGGPGEQ